MLKQNIIFNLNKLQNLDNPARPLPRGLFWRSHPNRRRICLPGCLKLVVISTAHLHRNHNLSSL